MRCIFLSLFMLLVSACSTMQVLSLPQLAGDVYNPQLAQQCGLNYVHGHWQFVHSITFEMANGHGATVIGVTVLDGEIIKTALMGVEGFVLFEAELDATKNLDVKRALPPFDKAEFAAGLMRDVQAIFVLPSGEKPVTAYLADGVSVCRYSAENAQVSDLMLELDGSSKINVYDANHKRIKSIVTESHRLIDGVMIPQNIQLIAYGLQGYTLNMALISAAEL